MPASLFDCILIRDFIVRQIINEAIHNMLDAEPPKPESAYVPTVEEALAEPLLPPPPRKREWSLWDILLRMFVTGTNVGDTYYYITMQVL